MNFLSHGKFIAAGQFFTDKVEDYWHILYPQTPMKEKEADPYLYFYDISRKALDYRGPFDSEGIYLFQGYDGKPHLHALEIAQYALACWLAWRKTEQAEWRERALLHCDWLIAHQDKRGALLIEHKNPLYADLPTPWPSALAQGLAVSALLRAFRATDGEAYRQAARKAADFLRVGVEKGGVFRRLTDGAYLYEEYPRPTLSGVLNGHISAVFALMELGRAEGEFDNLLKLLPRYDTGYWSLYALDGTLASGFYHRHLITQLGILEEMDGRFTPFKERFAGYLRSPFCAAVALTRKMLGRRR